MTWLSRLDRRCISGHTLGRILLLALKYNRFVIATPPDLFSHSMYLQHQYRDG